MPNDCAVNVAQLIEKTVAINFDSTHIMEQSPGHLGLGGEMTHVDYHD